MSYIQKIKNKEILMSERDLSGIDEKDIILEVCNAIDEISKNKKVKTFFDIGASKGNFSFISLF